VDVKDFPAQLLELALELQDTAPKGQEDPQAWMKRAEDFADACIVDGRLSQQLFAALPLKVHGDFIRHIRAIKAAGSSYNTGLRTNIDNGLAFIIKALNREVRAEPKHIFSVASISELTNRLTNLQKRLLDEVWNYFIASGNLFPLRSLPRIIGKQSVKEAFEGLNGGLIYETMEQGDRCFKLTIYGALLTGYGTALAVLLIRLLDLVKELYENDSFIKAINRSQIKDRLGLSDADLQLLLKLLILGLPPGMPISLANWTQDGSAWTVSISDEVIGLFRSDETVAYLDGHLCDGYRADQPCLYDDRRARELRGGALPNPPLAPFMAVTNQSWEQNPPPFVSPLRVEELKSIENTRFDCTRLIRMCEELNECAARENAHAVIMLTRAILDHVPPVFECKSFTEVASNYGGGGSSFRKSIERLENHSRKVADRLLHLQIRNKEGAPNMHEVSFAAELETMLAEFCRLLKER